MLFCKRRNTFYFICICLGAIPAPALLTDSLSCLWYFWKWLIAKLYTACNSMQFYVFIYKRIVSKNIWKGIRLWAVYFGRNFKVQVYYIYRLLSKIQVFVFTQLHNYLKKFSNLYNLYSGDCISKMFYNCITMNFKERIK